MRLALALLLLSTVSGCKFWYKPVPVANAIGEEQTVLAGDTVHVYRSDRFEVYAPNAEAVYDGYEQLNRAYRAFERYFGARAPRLAVILSPDTATPLPSQTARAFRERDFTLLRYVRPRSYRNPTRYGALGYGGVIWPVAPSAARTLLARYSAERVGARNAPDSIVLNRLPLWYRAAIIHLVGEAGAPHNDLEYVKEKRAHWVPMQQLLTFVRPASADSALDPARRGEADDFSRIVAAQASTFANYLVEQEGFDVIGRIGRGYLQGRSLAEILREFRRAPRTVPELDRGWRAWIETRD